MATVPPAPRAGPAPVPRRRRRGGRLLQAAAAALAALALPRAGAAQPAGPCKPHYACAGPENLLGVEASKRCRVDFSNKGHLEAVIFFNPTVTEAFSDRSDRDALTAPASMFAKSFYWVFPPKAPPTVAINGWRKKKKGGGWKKAYAVVTTVVSPYWWGPRRAGWWKAKAQRLQYRLRQSPELARVNKNFGGKNLGGKTVELRFCTMFLNELHWKFKSETEEAPASPDP